MTVQVFSLMWLRTTINYQYRYGTSTSEALRTLYKDGGVRRFYRGLLPALLQGPLSRFGDTAANAGTLSLLDSYDSTRSLPVAAKTLAASMAAGSFRVLLMPVDALKTILQVEGKDGGKALLAKVRAGGPTVLYHGALASALATFVGHYPWFATYNTLDEYLPKPEKGAPLYHKLGRSALMGFCSSLVSDCASNSVRVVKTAKQASTVPVTYQQALREILAKEGVVGLTTRGLKTKLVANGLQGIMFTVVWRLGQDVWQQHNAKQEEMVAFQSQGHAR